MYFYKVAPTTMVRKDSDFFTYSSEQQLLPGQIVKIPVGKKDLIGLILETAPNPDFGTKPIEQIITTRPIPSGLAKTATWLSKYYNTHLSQNIKLLIPSGVDKKRRQKNFSFKKISRLKTDKKLTKDQYDAIDRILRTDQVTNLLFGVTGSGKTTVYIECIKNLFNNGKSAVVLVPEIALTSQIVDEFRLEFGDQNILVSHSKQTEAERHKIWLEALTAENPKIIIGPRSALFLPIHDLGLIVIDEFHEPSFKQDQQPKYSAIRAATILAQKSKAKVILGSATPPIAEFYLAKQKKSNIIRLEKPAQKTTSPDIKVIDMKKRTNFLHHRFLSDQLITSISENLKNGQQTLIFHNRRGSAPLTICQNCGWTAVDPQTEIPLTLHIDRHLLVSHSSSFLMKVPTSCPVCGEPEIIHKGIGTKLIESEIKKLFPKAIIGRFDGDNTSGEAVFNKYDEIYSGQIQIIIGTQVIAKGLDLPKLATVGVVQADTGLSLPDFSSNERAFQLLSQVVGRVGRNSNQTSIIIQSYNPTHPAVKYGISQDYANFYESEIKLRKKGYFPPFSYLLQLTCVYKTEATAIKNSKKLIKNLRQISSGNVKFFGPSPAFYEKNNGTYRWQIIAKSSSRKDLIEIINHLPPKNWQYELDPNNLL